MVKTSDTLIRKAVKNDANELNLLARNLSHFYLKNNHTELPEWFAKTLHISEFERRLENDYFTHFVALQNNNIVGYIAMRGENHLYHLFVTESAQRRGIARRLWEHIINTLPSDIYTLRSSIHAISVYQQFGFITKGEPGEREGICYQEMEFKA